MSISRSNAAVGSAYSAVFGAWVRSRLLTRARVLQVASIIGGLLLWELIASNYSHFILPPPSRVLMRLLDPSYDIKLVTALGAALQHMFVGFGLTLALAIPLGILMGRIPRLDAMLDPVVNALYAIPSVAFVPFLIIWFGLFFESRVALVFIMSFPDVLVVIVAGSRDIRRNLIDVGRSFGANRLELTVKVMLPAMLPFVTTALRVGLARAINGMITAELFLAAVNLGELMKASARSFDSAGVLAVVVVICLVGLLAQSLIAAFEVRYLHWHHRK